MNGWPVFGGLPILLWIIRRNKSKAEKALAILIVGQIFAYFCYQFHDLLMGPRFWYETIGFIFILSACALSPLMCQKVQLTPELNWNKSSLSILRLSSMFAFILFIIYGLSISLPKKAIRYGDMISRGTRFQKSYQTITFPPKSILVVPMYYNEWSWVFGPKISNNLLYINDRGSEENQSLMKQYPDWNFYIYRPEKVSWEKLP